MCFYKILHTILVTTMLKVVLFVVLNMITAFAIANETKEVYRVHTSCYERGETPWTVAKPHRLRSWFGSVVPGMSKAASNRLENVRKFLANNIEVKQCDI